MAAGLTYEAIATSSTLTSGTSYTFSSISQSYTDLVLACSVATASLTELYIRVNGLSSGNYSYITIDASGTASHQGNVNSIKFGSATSSSLSTGNISFLNYSGTTLPNKPIMGLCGSSDNTHHVGGGAHITSAITSITIFTGSPSFTDATFTLYGIARA